MLGDGSAKLEELGGIYIKFLQIVVLNLDPQKQRNYKDLLAVYEQSKPDSIHIWSYLGGNLSAYQLSQIKRVTEEPFATGSFGQVYRAELASGQEVVVKVLRPSVEKYLRYDLRLIGLLSQAFSLVDKQNIINFRSMFKQFKQSSLLETDYIHEAQVANHYYQRYADHPSMVIPKTYLELSNRRVIVQEYVHGLSVTSVLELQTNGHDPQAYVSETLNSDLFHQLQVVGAELLGKAVLGEIMQADPHPGNIILLPNNKVALIDFGMSSYLATNRFAFYEMLVQYVKFYSGNLAIEDFSMSALKFLEPDLHEAITHADKLLGEQVTGDNSMQNKVKSAVREMFDDESNQPMIARLLDQKMIMKVLFFAINKGNRFGFSFDLQAINLIKAAQNYLMLMGQFDKDGIVIYNVLKEVVEMAENNFDQVVDMQAGNTDPAETIETLSHWLDKMARNDPWLMNKLAEGYFR